MNEYDDLVFVVFLLTGRDMSSVWSRMLQDDIPSISQDYIMQLWQNVLQLDDTHVLSVLFECIQTNKVVKSRVLLLTKEGDEILVCNGVGSDNLVLTSVKELVDFLDWWINLPTCDIPFSGVHPLYKKVFKCSVGVRSVHLFSEFIPIQDSNLNLRLAHFNMLCEASKLSKSFEYKKQISPTWLL
jgi:hypothetical protein